MFGKKTMSSVQMAGTVKAPPAPAPVTTAPLAPAAATTAETSPAAAVVHIQTTATASFTDPKLVTPDFIVAKQMLVENLLEQINFEALESVSKEFRKARISDSVDTLISGINIPLTAAQTAVLKNDSAQ